MKIKVSAASGTVLDWMVAKCWYADRRVELTEGKTGVRVLRDPTYDGSAHSHWFVFFASTSPEQAYPIIEREEIGTKRRAPCMKGEEWEAMGSITAKGAGYRHAIGPTPLIAAMRCYVTAKLGEEVEVPDELA